MFVILPLDGSDFTGTEEMLTFDEGINQICRDISITDDDVTERPEETFEVVITSSDSQADVGPPSRANVIIEDDDRKTIHWSLDTLNKEYLYINEQHLLHNMLTVAVHYSS